MRKGRWGRGAITKPGLEEADVVGPGLTEGEKVGRLAGGLAVRTLGCTQCAGQRFLTLAASLNRPGKQKIHMRLAPFPEFPKYHLLSGA